LDWQLADIFSSSVLHQLEVLVQAVSLLSEAEGALAERLILRSQNTAHHSVFPLGELFLELYVAVSDVSDFA